MAWPVDQRDTCLQDLMSTGGARPVLGTPSPSVGTDPGTIPPVIETAGSAPAGSCLLIRDGSKVTGADSRIAQQGQGESPWSRFPSDCAQVGRMVPNAPLELACATVRVFARCKTPGGVGFVSHARPPRAAPAQIASGFVSSRRPSRAAPAQIASGFVSSRRPPRSAPAQITTGFVSSRRPSRAAPAQITSGFVSSRRFGSFGELCRDARQSTGPIMMAPTGSSLP
jgi:hypothetical protein